MAKVKLAGKNALITGGARGIGKATARLFQAEGATLILIDCDESALKATQAELGEDTFAFVCDVSKPDSVKRAMDDTRRAVGELRILFANAGIAHCPPLPQTGEAFFDHIMGVKVKGVFFSFLHALPILARDSSAIFTSSSAADRGRPGDVLYSASKAAVRSLARCFAGHEDVLEKKIRVNVLAAPSDTHGTHQESLGNGRGQRLDRIAHSSWTLGNAGRGRARSTFPGVRRFFLPDGKRHCRRRRPWPGLT
jgi:NAD(P)-dependent dehydrogenase (short-subunit alcohol dehydrogenase family)